MTTNISRPCTVCAEDVTPAPWADDKTVTLRRVEDIPGGNLTLCGITFDVSAHDQAYDQSLVLRDGGSGWSVVIGARADTNPLTWFAYAKQWALDEDDDSHVAHYLHFHTEADAVDFAAHAVNTFTGKTN